MLKSNINTLRLPESNGATSSGATCIQGRKIGPNTNIEKLVVRGGNHVKLRATDADLLSILNQKWSKGIAPVIVPSIAA